MSNYRFCWQCHTAGVSQPGDMYCRNCTSNVTVAIPDEPEEHIAFDIRDYRDVNRTGYTQVTAQCKCGRGGFIRIPHKPEIK